MTCSNCSASWALPAGRPAPSACPFCGKPLAPSWREIHTPQEGFAWALELMGQEGLRDGSRVMGLFADAGPALQNQLQLVRIFFDSRSHISMLDSLNLTPSAQALARSRSLSTLVSTYYLAEPAARYICDSFWFAVTGSGTAVLANGAAPAPARTTAPVHYPSLSLSECTRLAESNDPAALRELAFRYELGRGGAPQNRPESIRWWRRAAENGDPEGQCTLGWAYHDGSCGLPRDKNAALGWFKKAAAQNHGDGFYAIGWMYEQGSLLVKNLDAALDYYQKAAANNSFWGPEALGWVYEEKARQARENGSISSAFTFDQKAAECYTQALEHFRRRASTSWWEATHCTAQLGWLHYKGQGTPANPAAALGYFEQAAKEGSDDAMLGLGLMHYQGESTAQNIPLALQWLEKAAALGNRSAADWLADIYLSAPAPHQNYPRAKTMAAAGLESPYPPTVAFCHNILGWIFQNGLGTPADSNAAFRHYRLAAEGGDPSGMFNLALCYYDGIGTHPDTAAARQWLREAVASAGDNNDLRQAAQEALDNI